jgi:hypothetical protein
VFKHIYADVYDEHGIHIANKNYWACDDLNSINDWLKQYYLPLKKEIGILNYRGTDFGNSNMVFLALAGNSSKDRTQLAIGSENLVEVCMYSTVRHVIPADWLNDRDQFLSPHDNWKIDKAFQNDCLIYMLFHGQNRISSTHGTNLWIPFTEKEVGAQEKFDSNFMSGFLKEKTFNAEAQAVLDAGRELWRYYHAKIKNNRTVSVNASYYDIREFFQGRNDKGTMKIKSDDETYNALLAALRGKIHALTEKIQPNVYEYGFLRA